MCTDCDEITIPTGAPGTNGTNGAAGVKGDTGLTGANGQNGTTILSTYNSITGIGSTADLVETVLFTKTLTANTLNTNGDELELYMVYKNDGVNDSTLRIKLGSKIHTISFTGLSAALQNRTLRLKISRISSTSQLWVLDEIKATALGAYSVSLMSLDSSTVDLTTILAFEITAQNTVAAVADSILLKKATLYKYAI